MFRKSVLIVIVLLALLAAACTPAATNTPGPQPAATEVMETPDDEMMNEDGDEMMDENSDEMMDENGDEMMDENGDEMMETVTFVIRIENAAPAGGLTILAPGAWELNDHPVSFFTPGEPDRGLGLEALAEDGNPAILVEMINGMMEGDMAGFAAEIFDTPVGADAPGPVTPGGAYEFTVVAYPGQFLTFATMFVQSNDWFFSPGGDGIALFDKEGNPINGDITDQVFLWDAGTEVDQTPGEGGDQAPRQAAPNSGEDENGLVEMVSDFEDTGIVITITPQQ